MQSYVVGLDGGGTKTAVAVRFSHGGGCSAVFGPLNLCGNAPETVAQTLRDVTAFLAQLPGGLGGCRSLCVSGAGISSPASGSFLRGQLEQSGFAGRLLLVGDHESALAGALGNRDGLVLIAGTGSICCGRSGDQTARSGGWGYLIGDKGSGYAIGRDILSAVVRVLDGRARPTCLTQAVFRHLSLHSPQELVGFVYHPDTGKAQIASLAVLLPKAVEAEDPAAIAITRGCAQELAGLAHAVITRLRLPQGPLVPLGSILLNHPAIADGTRERLLADFPDLRFAPALGSAAQGAALLAEGEGSPQSISMYWEAM